MKWAINGFFALLFAVLFTALSGSLFASAASVYDDIVSTTDSLVLEGMGNSSGNRIDISTSWFSEYGEAIENRCNSSGGDFCVTKDRYDYFAENLQNLEWGVFLVSGPGYAELEIAYWEKGEVDIVFGTSRQWGQGNYIPTLEFNGEVTVLYGLQYNANNDSTSLGMSINTIPSSNVSSNRWYVDWKAFSYNTQVDLNEIFLINADIAYPNDYDGPQIPSTVEPPAPDPIEYPDFFEGGTSGLESCGLLDLSCWRDKLKPAQVIENFTDRISVAWSNLTLPFQLIIDLLKTLANDFKGGTIECGQYGYIGAEHQWHPSACISEFGPMIGGTGTINIYWGMIEYRLPALWNIGKVIIRTMLAIGLVMGWFRFVQSLANEKDDDDG